MHGSRPSPSAALSSLLIALVLTAGGLTGSGGDQAWASRTATFSATDSQLPTVTIASPAAGATLGGTVTVSGSASDNVSLSKVELRVDGNAYQLASGTSSWTFSLNTSAYASGSHTLLARATDASGNQAWASRTVTFSSATDSQVPTVAISSPAAGATVGGTVTVSGSASDNVSLSKVELRVDSNAYQLASGTSSWTFSLNTSAYASGSHTLLARATDASGNQAWASRTVTISMRDGQPGADGRDREPGRRRDVGGTRHRVRQRLRQRLPLEGGAAGGRQRLPAGQRHDAPGRSR